MKGILTLTVVLCTLSIGAFLTHTGGRLTVNEINKAGASIAPVQASLREGGQQQIEPINKEKLQEIIKNRNGRALLINVWATWCGPCREEFPGLVKLEREFKNKKLDIVAISVDDKKEIETKVKPFLREQKANFKVYSNGFSKDEEFMDFFDKKWQGDIPVTMIYDPKGNRKDFLIGSQDYATFKKKVEAAM